MATKVHHIEAMKGLDGLQALMLLITNPAKYDSVLKELVKIREEVTAKIELIGPADKIPAMYSAAKNEMDQAKRNADAILKKAHDSINASREKLEAEEKAFEAQIAEANAKMNGRSHHLAAERQTLMKMDRELKEDRKEVDERLEALALAENKAAALVAEYTEKLRRFKEATSE